MNSLYEYFRQAELAFAAYASLFADIAGDGFVEALENDGDGMSRTQGLTFVSKWVVVDQYTHSETQEIPIYDDGGNITGYTTRTVSNGLSVTVFEDVETGKRHVAVRGTEITDLSDLAADGGVILHGIPDLSDQYQALKQKIEDWQAIGVLGDTFGVTGHSLGGWLAQGLAVDFASSIEHTYVFNSPGVFGAGFGEIFDQINEALGTSFLSVPSIENLTSIRGSAGNFIISGLGQALTEPIDIFIEDQTRLDVQDRPLALNHSQRVLMDSLAVYALFGEMSPAVAVETIGHILDASGNRNAMSLEKAVNALADLFGAGSTIVTTDDRDALYARIQAIRDSSGFQIATQSRDFISIVAIDGASEIDLAQKALSGDAEGLAYRYALSRLAPFVILGEPAIFAGHNAGEELELYDPATGLGELSEEYLRDRASMLAWKIRFDTGGMDDDDHIFDGDRFADRTDKPYGEDWDSGSVRGDWNYVDLSAGTPGEPLSLFIDGRGERLFAADPDHQIVFGSAGVDVIGGTDTSDRLYAGSGKDILNGGSGNDHLEGGTGFDTYVFGPGDGTDTVLDSDGQGVVRIDGVDAVGRNGLDPWEWLALGQQSWADLQNGILYSLETVGGESRLLVRRGGINILVRGWSEGELGISLAAEALPLPDPVVTDHVIAGDLEPADFDAAEPGIQTQTDDLGNVIGTDVAKPGREDVLYDGFGNDLISGLAGDDRIVAWRGGNDRLLGGDGSDILDGGDGDDELHAGAGSDLEAALALGEGQSGSGRRGDLLSGAGGEDRLVGDAGNDILAGGTGNDVLLGMGGDDIIEGDATVLSAAGGWQVQRSVVEQDGVALYVREYNFSMASADHVEEGGNDRIHAGSGHDWVLAGGGDDLVDGGAGDDVVFGGAGDDVILGQDGSDVISGDSLHPNLDAALHGRDFLYGGAGDDEIWGGGGADILDGGDGSDVLVGDGDDVPIEFQGDDYLAGGYGDDTIYGNGGNDTLHGGPGNDVLYGGKGDDTYLDVEAGDLIADVEGHNTIVLKTARGTASERSPTLASSADSTLGIPLDDGGSLELQAALYGMSATLQFGSGTSIDLESWVSENLANPAFLNLDGVALPSGGLVENAYGGAGDDQILGGRGNDRIRGHGGNDFVQGGAGDDVLEGGAGDDALLGEGGEDTLMGGAGDDELQGNAGNDVLHGADGSDTLFGQDGNDTLDGGAGDDVLVGGAGDDVYLFGPGSGQDVVWEEGDSSGDLLRFEGGIAAADVTVAKTGVDLVLTHAKGSDQVTIANWYAGPYWQLSRFEFADGTVWGGDDVGSRGASNLRGTVGSDAIYGTSADEALSGLVGDDQLWGNDGADVLEGGEGNDWLIGGGGADVYLYALGDGHDVIDADNSDTLVFDADIARDDLTIERTGADLLLRHANGGDSVRIANWYSAAAYRLKNVLFEANNSMLSASQLSALGTLIDHHYVFSLGDGNKTIEDWGGLDTVVIASGIDAADLAISRVANDLQLIHVNGSDSLVIKDWFDDLQKQIETIRFESGGVVLTHGQLTAPFLDLTGTEAGETLQGGNAYGERLYGMGGDDLLRGGGGTDELSGGSGNDQLFGGDGADTYYFNAGDGQDTITDTSYGNTHIFGVGLLASYSVSGGFGQDTVYSFAGTGDSLRIKAGSNVTVKFVSEGTARADSFEGSAFGDIVHSLDGDDTIDGNEGADVLYGDGGNDTLAGGAGSDWLYGGDGDDVLDGYLLAGPSDDQTYGSDSGDYYVGGKGNDVLQGNAAGDTYFFDLGDGHDQIVEGTFFYNGRWFYSSDDELRFGAGVSPEGIEASKSGNDLLLRITDADSVTVRNWFADSKSWVDTFRFADGSSIGASDMTRRALTQIGTAGHDSLVGDPSWGDTLRGHEGNDVLEGQGGSDLLEGGAGDDRLMGGGGDDEYLFERGDGRDTIVESSGSDTVRFGASISSNDVSLARDGNHLVLELADSGDALTISNFLVPAFSFGFGDRTYARWNPDYRVENFVFSDGSRLPSAAEILALFSVLGSSDADDLQGSPHADVIHGGGDDDILQGMDGDDALYGDDGADCIYGGEGDDNLVGGTGDDTLHGGGSTDILVGDDGNDLLSGGVGSDSLVGGAGADSYLYSTGDGLDHIYDFGAPTADEVDRVVLGPGIRPSEVGFGRWGDDLDIELPGGRITINRHFENAGYAVERLEMADGSAVGLTDIQFGDGLLEGTAADSILVGGYASDTLYGGVGNDWLAGAGGGDRMFGGAGDDRYFVDYRRDSVYEAADEGMDTVYSTIGFTLGANVENLVLTGTDATKGVDNALDNLLLGNGAANSLTGGTGNDILFGNAGADAVKDTAGNNLLYGGADADTLTGAVGNEVFIGGTGNDTVTTGSGADVILFNRGDGTDIVVGSVGADNTLSLGGGIRYADLSLSRASSDLILNVGGGEQIVFKSWYAKKADYRSVATLQVVVEASADYDASSSNMLHDNRVEQFDFLGMVGAFDRELSSNPGLTAWSLTHALAEFHVGGSDTEALGGDLSYYYGREGSLGGVGLRQAQEVLGSTWLGVASQGIRPQPVAGTDLLLQG